MVASSLALNSATFAATTSFLAPVLRSFQCCCLSILRRWYDPRQTVRLFMDVSISCKSHGLFLDQVPAMVILAVYNASASGPSRQSHGRDGSSQDTACATSVCLLASGACHTFAAARDSSTSLPRTTCSHPALPILTPD